MDKSTLTPPKKTASAAAAGLTVGSKKVTSKTVNPTASAVKSWQTVATTKATGVTAGDTAKEKKSSLQGKYYKVNGKINASLKIK